MVRRRADEAAPEALVVPPDLLPFTPRERREAAVAGSPIPSPVWEARHRDLQKWFEARGVGRGDIKVRAAAELAGRQRMRRRL